MRIVRILALAVVVLTVTACSVADPMTVRGREIEVGFNPDDCEISVLDHRNNMRWEQRPLPFRMDLVKVQQNRAVGDIDATYRTHAGTLIHAKLTVDRDRPEVLLSISSAGLMHGPMAFPGPFVAPSNDYYLVLPLNEGVAWNVDDPTIIYSQFGLNDAHGLCMPFFGMTNGRAAMMAIVETPDDARIQITRDEGPAAVMPIWEPQHGKWGYERQIRYVFMPQGGHVAIAKRFRQYATDHGMLKTLAEKRRERPNVDMLVGAANVWFWNEKEALEIAREMKAEGIDRILWSHSNTPEVVKELNDLGVLTGRYEIYAGAIDPAQAPHAVFPKADWPEEAWPGGLLRNAHDRLVPGWQVKLDDGSITHAQQVCDSVVPPMAERKIAAELKTHPYRARFLDTTAAYLLQECYDPRHPMTRSQDRVARERLLALLGNEFSLVTGSEDGVACYVPYCDYFEGTLSISPFRMPDDPGGLLATQDPPPYKLRELQLNERIRIPLWQLVFHDCAVSYWHWDEYNNRAPAVWHKKDLFNALYGTPPMYMFPRRFWRDHRTEFLDSYRATAPLARAVGYSEMTDHRFVTADRSVQQTTFANGIKVTVNFSESEHRMADGYVLPAGGLRVEGQAP